MKCLKCKKEIENDDNFCWNCGHWTAKGFTFLKDEENYQLTLKANQQTDKLSILLFLVCVGVSLFLTMMFVQKNNLFKPMIYLKKQFMFMGIKYLLLKLIINIMM